MLDLFRTKTELIQEYCKAEHFVSSAKIEEFGQGIGVLATTAKRMLQRLVEQGHMKKLSKDECIMRGFMGKMGYYEWVGI